jgi:nijmegen breakage syndrome protein 1
VAKEPVAQNTSVKRSRPRRAVTSRFTGFDLGDDDTASASMAPIDSMQESMDMDRAPDESQGLFVSQDPDREIQDINADRQHSQSVEPDTVQARTSRKRAASPIQEESEDESIVKRRRLMDEVARREKEQPAPVIKKEVAVEKKKKDKEKKEIDILALAAQQREKTEAAARAEQESLNETPGNIDINEIRNLTIVEEIEVVRNRPAPRTRAHADESDRWDDKWNGRKNFKKFRRRGADGPLRAPTRVIVPLEEVKKKGFGIGDEYWGEDDSSQRRKKKGKGRDTQTQETEEPVPDLSTRSRPAGSHSRASRTVVNDDEEDLPENPLDAKHTDTIPSEDEVQNSARSRPSHSLRGSSLADKTNASQNLSTQKSTAKRPAASSLTKPAPVKRVRRAMARKEDSDDSDSDEDRFKFRR